MQNVYILKMLVQIDKLVPFIPVQVFRQIDLPEFAKDEEGRPHADKLRVLYLQLTSPIAYSNDANNSAENSKRLANLIERVYLLVLRFVLSGLYTLMGTKTLNMTGKWAEAQEFNNDVALQLLTLLSNLYPNKETDYYDFLTKNYNIIRPNGLTTSSTVISIQLSKIPLKIVLQEITESKVAKEMMDMALFFLADRNTATYLNEQSTPDMETTRNQIRTNTVNDWERDLYGQ